ncbi:MAG: hypothetical protein J2P21_16185 [Chloracidobacterium sp.]|nr:hypothetical protein [Chloracidobacterium sp.]
MNSARTMFVGIAFFCVALLLPPPSFPYGQSDKCSDLDLVAALQPTDKSSYSMAMELAQTLQARGFIIKCVLTSKMGGSFEELEGAALFRTNRGDFEALFLPKTKTFERLVIHERQVNSRYIHFHYSFDGDPKPGPSTGIDSSRRWYFVKHAHMLLEMDDDALANDLRQALTGR